MANQFGQNALIHIGYHKTATNWFQRNYYPKVTNVNYIHRRLVREALLEDSGFQFDVDESRKRLGCLAEDRVILCEEELSGNLHNGGLFGCLSKEVAYRAKSLLPDASVVIFIRNQISMISSVYGQYIKEGGTHTPKRYLFPHDYLTDSGFAPRYSPLFSFDHFDYLPLIQHYQKVFGQEKVHIYLFEDFRQNLESFMADYASTHDLETNWSNIGLSSVNKSYKKAVIPVARLLNRFTYRDVIDKTVLLDIPYFYKLRRNILSGLNKIPGGKTPNPEELLGKEMVTFIEQRYAESNHKIVDELGLPLQKYNYPLV